MARMARMKRNFPTRNPEPIQTEPQQQNAFFIRVIREIRGFSFGAQVKPENQNWPPGNETNTAHPRRSQSFQVQGNHRDTERTARQSRNQK